uniref:hypothetical protein n=1 Tax=Psychrobacillus sp. FSL H8-0483 TaxID=2921389 RepID=UPI00406C7C47
MGIKCPTGDEMVHNYSGEIIQFDIKYKKRTTIGITMDHYGNIEVLAPKGTPDERVIQLLEDKWEKVYEHGESFLYLGDTYPIRIYHDINITQDHVVLEGDFHTFLLGK